RRSIRAKLDLPDLLGGSFLLTYQRDHHDIEGTPRELTYVPLEFRGLLRQYDPRFDEGRPSGRHWPIQYKSSLDTPQFRTADIDTFAAVGSHDLAGWGLNVVAGWSRLESLEVDDADSAPWLADSAIADETSRQTTFEFRVASPDLAGFLGIGDVLGRSLGSTDFTSGFFYQRREQTPTFTRVDLDVPILLLATALNREPSDEPQSIPRPPQKLEFFQTFFEQTTDEFSGYGQMNWHFVDRWTLLYGMRLAYTKKGASWDQTTGPADAILVTQAADSFRQAASRGEFHFAPKVGAKFDWSDDANLYATWSHNYQAGGFNNLSTSADLSTRVVKPARVQSWEAGAKTRLLDGTAELNLGLFWMTMKDFQLFTVSAPPGEILPTSQVLNVGELRARGVEADATWLPTDWLTLRGALGFNDAEYLDFPIGTCMQDRQNTDGDDDPRCDLKGRPLEQAPHWEASLTQSVRAPLTSIPGSGGILPSLLRKVDLAPALSVQYTDNRYLNDSDDPRQRQSSYFFLDGSLGLAHASRGWSLRFRVDNITNAKISATSFEAFPMAGVYRAVLPPRVMYGEFRYEF
ncbi:MAG: TonB-dependent receptor, partial [Candidatus Binatia bacterium]